MSQPPSLWPRRLIDQDFGMCITPNDFIWPFYSTNYFRPWNLCRQDVNHFGSTIDNQTDSFKVTMDVQHFRPNEISVKVINNQIFVEGKHEERKDEYGFVTRQFTRRYALPENCLSEDVISTLSSDGILTVIARKKSECEFMKNERIVPIKLCKSCPLETQGNIKNESIDRKDDTKQERDEKKVGAAKKNTQIMLKEDHCCLLLKPELLRDATAETAEIISETDKQKEEYERQKACKERSEQVKNTSEMLQESLAKSKLTDTTTKLTETAGKMEQTCGKASSTSTSADMVEQVCKTSAAISSSAGIMEQTCGKSSSTSTSADMVEQVCKSGAAISSSAGIMEQSCSKASAVTSSSAEMMEQACGKSKSKEVVGQSSMTTSQVSEQTAMSSKTSEFIESSTSYKSSIASSIKEMSEELSDFVCDIICSELEENKDTKK